MDHLASGIDNFARVYAASKPDIREQDIIDLKAHNEGLTEKHKNLESQMQKLILE
jgi:hypothetical protein